MSKLIAIAFEDETRAEEVRTELLKLQKEYVVELEDAVVAVRKSGDKVKLRQMHDLTLGGAVTGGFWGTLIGLIFMNPLLGLLVGGAGGAVAGALSDVGINDDFMKRLSEKLQPGSSALFILLRDATPDRLLEALDKYEGEVLQTSLTHENEEKLRAVLNEAQQTV
jgi:uncharacterized membrane protein